MKFGIYTYTSFAILIALTIGIVTPTTTTEIIRPSYAQSTGDFPTSPDSTPDSSSSASDGDNFQQFMSCMFGGDASEEDIANALDGSGDQPTEQEIRDCFAPLYNTGGASGATTTGGSGPTDDGGSTGDSDGTDQSSEEQDEDSGNDGGSSGQ
jgi:hypothetical protein